MFCQGFLFDGFPIPLNSFCNASREVGSDGAQGMKYYAEECSKWYLEYQ